MAVTSGFFDAVLNNGVPDRKYGAEDFGAIFDGIISDGIFKNYPTPDSQPFRVTPTTDASLQHLAVQINPGRAWLDRTWTLNDSTFIKELNSDRDLNSPRIDSIYIKVDKDARMNSIEVFEGAPATVPVPTVPADTQHVKYHLIAYIKVSQSGSGSQTDPIREDEITNMINIDGGTPYVKSNINDINVTTETIINNLEQQFDSYQIKYGQDFATWFQSIKDSIGGITPDQVVEVAEMVAETYSSDYLSGVYPYVENTGLYLSSDKKVTPPVIINFGFVSASMSKNPNANEIEIFEGTITS